MIAIKMKSETAESNKKKMVLNAAKITVGKSDARI